MTLSDNARAFAEQHRVAHLATADATGAPHVIPVCYALVGDCFYFVIDEKPKRTRTGLKRLRNIQQNPQVALVIDDYDEDWTRLAYLLVHGEAVIVDDRAEYQVALGALRARYPQYRAMPLAFDTHPLVRITPTRAHAWRAAPAR
ncbi:MAG: TIGR03668 family PPOX class F420-dependent oxidoreductase [Candidatus Binatia bacterium]